MIKNTKNTEVVKQYKIEVIGIDLSISQNKAIEAIYKLLDREKYQCQTLKVTPAEYLEAYGVNKTTTKRGWDEYSRSERDEALKSLESLTRPCLFVYTEHRWEANEKGKLEEKINLVEAIYPLIMLGKEYKDLSTEESENIKQRKHNEVALQKLTTIIIDPCPVFYAQINNYFVLKPANLTKNKQGVYSEFSVK